MSCRQLRAGSRHTHGIPGVRSQRVRVRPPAPHIGNGTGRQQGQAGSSGVCELRYGPQIFLGVQT